LDKSNLLGGYGWLKFTNVQSLRIEIEVFELKSNPDDADVGAFVNTMKQFHAELVTVGECFPFDLTGSSTLRKHFLFYDMQIGVNYLHQYIFKLGDEAGAYLEWHEQPHYHQPMNADSGGFLILARYVDADGNTIKDKHPGDKGTETVHLQIKGFKIPFGRSVYMHPYALHADNTLIGDYLVGYTRADHNSVVRVKNKNDKFMLITSASKKKKKFRKFK